MSSNNRLPFRCIFCNHQGEWITVYVKAANFLQAIEYLQDKPEMWIIKEISERIGDGELSGKQIENA